MLNQNISKIDHKIFPTLVSIYKNFLDEVQILDISNYCLSKNHSGKHNALVGNGISSHKSADCYFLHELQENIPSCHHIITNVDSCLEDYEKSYGVLRLQVANSWFSLQSKNSFLLTHTHPGSVISGVIYINADEKSSKLFFENPNRTAGFSEWNARTDTRTEFTYEWYSFDPIPGSMILFPSWLPHGSLYSENMTENRIIISFNTNVQNS